MSLSDQKQTIPDSRITFTMLANGWARCNWNGERIKKKAIENVRKRRWNELNPVQQHQTKLAAQSPLSVVVVRLGELKSARMTVDGWAFCPNMFRGSTCDWLNNVHGKEGIAVCERCKKDFRAVRLQKTTGVKPPTTEEIKEAVAMNSFGDVYCPHCSWLNLDTNQKTSESKGVRCVRCTKPFRVKPWEPVKVVF